MNSKALKNALSTLIIFFIFIGGIHLLLLEYILPETYKQFQLIYIYIFFLVLSIIGISLLFLVSKNDETLIGKGFLVYSVIKILSSAIFLYPWIAEQDDLTRPIVYQFFAVFFPNLIVETLVVLSFVNANTSKK